MKVSQVSVNYQPHSQIPQIQNPQSAAFGSGKVDPKLLEEAINFFGIKPMKYNRELAEAFRRLDILKTAKTRELGLVALERKSIETITPEIYKKLMESPSRAVFFTLSNDAYKTDDIRSRNHVIALMLNDFNDLYMFDSLGRRTLEFQAIQDDLIKRLTQSPLYRPRSVIINHVEQQVHDVSSCLNWGLANIEAGLRYLKNKRCNGQLVSRYLPSSNDYAKMLVDQMEFVKIRDLKQR